MSRLVILASQSPQRQAIMKAIGIDFKVMPANIDEQAIVEADPYKRAGLVAQAKAKAVQAQHSQAVVVAADTYLLLNGEVLEKPRILAEAEEMLTKQSGSTAEALTGFCYLDHKNNIEVVTTAVTEVKFRKFTSAEIKAYYGKEPVLTWSAAFCPAYDSGATLVESINGSFTGFTHGLPLEELIPLLQKSKLI